MQDNPASPAGAAYAPDQGQTPPSLDDLARTFTAAGKLNRRLVDAWPAITAVGSINRQEYQEIAGKNISMRTAQYDLQLLVQLGLVRKEGRGPAQRYVVLPAKV